MNKTLFSKIYLFGKFFKIPSTKKLCVGKTEEK